MAKNMPSAGRIRAEKRGRLSEWMAILLLLSKGYLIIERRFKTRQGEIDLIARRFRTIVFVEVKYRSKLDDAIASILPKQQQRISNASRVWRARNPSTSGATFRFDIIAVAKGRWPQHIINAFEEIGT